MFPNGAHWVQGKNDSKNATAKSLTQLKNPEGAIPHCDERGDHSTASIKGATCVNNDRLAWPDPYKPDLNYPGPEYAHWGSGPADTAPGKVKSLSEINPAAPTGISGDQYKDAKYDIPAQLN
jgi:hypothetical protein